ncbi:ABC-three component system protein [Streptococcus suis]|uniref:ABC-three component system protein n=2 Tax=Streptococcus suis TaxID=1307 RepID=UPI000CF59634|nr:ABC-three component system protein [Streptococcus suis]
MQEFNFSSYLKLMLPGMTTLKQGPLGITLLEPLSNLNGITTSIDDRKITRLVQRKIEVDSAFIQASNDHNIIQATLKNFEKNICSDLRIHNKQDIFDNILKCINSDSEASPKKYDELARYLENGQEVEFLTYSFLYALNKTNKMTDSAPRIEDIELLQQVRNKCPLCQKPLTRQKKDTTIRAYKIVEIFPSNLDKDTADKFKNFMPLAAKLDSYDNKIPLCIQDANEYENYADIDEYKKLLSIKQEIQKLTEIQEVMNHGNLETQITEVIDALNDYTGSSSSTTLNMTALKLNQKILPEHSVLRGTVQYHVLTYFSYIKDLFAENSNFIMIQCDIKKVFTQLANTNLSQPEIVENLANWLLNQSKLSNGHLDACKIIVSYFIQNCEVFNEITE